MPHELGLGVIETMLPEQIEDLTLKGPSSRWDINLLALKWGSKSYLFENSLSFLPTKQL